MHGHDHQLLSLRRAEDVEEFDQDEVDTVLSALRRLAHQVTMPVVRACLDQARSDIAHLASTRDLAEGLENEEGEREEEVIREAM